MSKHIQNSDAAGGHIPTKEIMRRPKPNRLAKKAKTGEATASLQTIECMPPKLLRGKKTALPANYGMNSKRQLRAKILDSHRVSDTRQTDAVESLATIQSKPNFGMRENNSGSRFVCDTQDHAAVIPAIIEPQPTVFAPGEITIGDGNASVARAGNVTQTTHGVRGQYFTPLEPPAEEAALIIQIQGNWRLRQRWHQAEKTLTLAAKSGILSFLDKSDTTKGEIDSAAKKERDRIFNAALKGEFESMGHEVFLSPFINALHGFKKQRENTEKTLGKTAKQLSIYPWAKAIYGLGDLGIAQIIGEAGYLGKYKSVAALWKRAGVAVIDGQRQRKVADADAALVHGFSPTRRAVFWNVSRGLVGAMGHGPRPLVGEDVDGNSKYSPYQKLFIKRLRSKCGVMPGDCIARPEWQRKPIKGKNGSKESYSQHAANDARRYVLKRFLRDILLAQRETTLRT